MRRKSGCCLGFSLCLTALMWLASSEPSLAQPPDATANPKVDPDTLLFVYRVPFADAGLIEVYLGVGGKYVRTTPFRLEKYDLKPDGSLLTVYLDVKMKDEDEKLIEPMLEQNILKENIKGTPPAVKAISLIWMKPFSVTVEILDSRGTKVGEYTQKNISQKDNLQRPLSIDPKLGMSFPISLKEPAKTEQISQYRVVVRSNYIVKTAQAQTAVFQSAIGGGIEALEKVMGGKAGEKLKAGDLIHRDATQLVARSQFVQRSVKMIDANAGDEKLIMDLLLKSLAKDVQFTDWNALGTNYTIWTPALGRLEVTPSVMNFEENEKSLKKSSKEGYKEKLNSFKNEAKKTGDFKEWFAQQKRKRSGEGSGAVNFEASADLMDMLSGSSSGGASYSFKNAVDNEDTDRGSYNKTEDIYKLLKEDKEVEKLFESYFESYWKGNNKIVDAGAKSFNIAVVRDISDASRELTEITRIKTYGTNSLQFQTAEIELRSSTAVTKDIAELRRQVTELTDRLNVPFAGQSPALSYWIVNGNGLSDSPRGSISMKGDNSYNIIFNYGVNNSKQFNSPATLDKDGNIRVEQFLKTNMDVSAENAIMKNVVGVRIGKHILWENGEHWIR